MRFNVFPFYDTRVHNGSAEIGHSRVCVRVYYYNLAAREGLNGTRLNELKTNTISVARGKRAPIDRKDVKNIITTITRITHKIGTT